MNPSKIFGAFITLIFSAFILTFIVNDSLPVSQVEEEDILAGIARSWVKSKTTEGILENYPFALENPPITIAEGFEAYDGNLLDKPGEFHWAIDYVKNDSGNYMPFPVYSAHSGEAFQGYGKSWGKFVVVKIRDAKGDGYNTLYSHLENVPKFLPYMNYDIDSSKGIAIDAMTYIGDAGKTGNTKGINQLHFELHKVEAENSKTVRLDPYGLYLRLSSGKYRQPGSSLYGLDHYWSSDNPEFVK